jgi:uncharacterized protein YwqG
MTSVDPELTAVAQRHLPAAVADRWTALLRPGLYLWAAGAGEPAVVELGGLPALPVDVAWPKWAERGPLNFVAKIDLGSIPTDLIDIELPADGTLLLFYRDPDLDGYEYVVEATVPGSQAGARVIYVPAEVPVVETTPPPGITPYTRVRLAAETIVTGPDAEHPMLAAAIQDLSAEDREFMDDVVKRDPFRLALDRHVPKPRHRIGGYANPIQGSVEEDAAQAQLGGVDYANPALYLEARRWTLLAQIDSDDDAGMRWGDCGRLYWLIRPEDLAASKFEAALFTWQTG